MEPAKKLCLALLRRRKDHGEQKQGTYHQFQYRHNAGRIIQTEDQKFFEHHGLDPEGIRKALRQNLRERQMAAGGSTITQQLIKNLYFHFHKSILRKIEELILVPFVEHMLGKRKILEFYMNIAYFGYGIYGIAGAARF